MIRRQFVLAVLAAGCSRAGNDRPQTPSSNVGLQDISEMETQIRTALERRACSNLYRVESISINQTRVVSTRPARLLVNATARLRSAETEVDLTSVGCNTLSWSRRLTLLRDAPSGGSAAFVVDAHFVAQESGWRISNVDFVG